MFRQDSRTRYCVLQWVTLRRARGYWLRIGTGYRGADGTIDVTCEPLVIGPHLRLIEIAPGDTDNLTTLLGWPGGIANDPPLLNSAYRSARLGLIHSRGRFVYVAITWSPDACDGATVGFLRLRAAS